MNIEVRVILCLATFVALYVICGRIRRALDQCELRRDQRLEAPSPDCDRRYIP